MKFNRGQSLLEVLITLSVATIIIGAVAAAIVIALANTKFVGTQTTASEYAQQAMEIMKQIKDADYATYSTYATNNYCFEANQQEPNASSSNTNGVPNTNGCSINLGSYVREVDIEKDSCDCGSNLATADQVRVDKVTVTVAWSDNKCNSSGTVPIGVSSGTTCSSGLQNRINSKYCHTVVLSSCFTRLFDVGNVYNTPVSTQTPEPTVPVPTIDPGSGGGTPTPTPAAVATGLISYWKLDESTVAESVKDSRGTNDGASTGTTVANTGKISRGRTFTVTSDIVKVTNNATLQIKPEMSLAAWVKTSDSGSAKFIMGKVGGPSPKTPEYALTMNNGQPRVILFNSDGNTFLIAQATSVISDGNWHYVVGTFTTSGSPQAQIYIDGILENSSTATTGTQSPAGTADFGIGQRSDGVANPLLGTIDEVGIWGRVLSTPEVKQLYNCRQGNQYPFTTVTQSSLCDNAVSYWKMDETSGTTTVVDNIGNAPMTSTSSTNVQTGKIGSARSFGSQTLTAAAPSGLQFSDNISVSLWYYRTSVTAGSYETLFARGGAATLTGELAITLQGANNIRVFRDGGAQFKDFSLTTTLNAWHHVVVVKDSSNNLTVYHDGVSLGTQTGFTLGTPASNLDITMGNWAGPYNSYYLNGRIDEVGIWHKVLSTTEVAQLYNCTQGNQYPFTTAATSSSSCGGLVSYWKMDEASGNVVDSIGGNTGTPTGTTVGDPAKISKGRIFNGTSDYIKINNATNLQVTSAYSLSAWINPASAQRGAIMGEWSAGNISFTVEMDANQQIVAYFSQNGSSIQNTTPAGFVPLNKWSHVSVTFNSGSLIVYLNGNQITSLTTTGSAAFAGTAPLYIGAYKDYGLAYFKGSIDEVGIWNKTLSATEVTNLFNCGQGNSFPFFSSVSSLCSGIVSYWTMDQTSGDVLDSISGNTGASPGTTSVGGRVTNARSFGGSDYINVTNNTTLQLTSAFTLSTWIKVTSNTAQQEIIGKWNTSGSGSQGYILRLESNGKLGGYACASSCSVVTGTTTVTTNAWHHVVFTFDGVNTGKLYLDNSLDNTNSSMQTPTSGTNNLSIGGRPSSNPGLYINGIIDEVGIWNKALTLADITTLYNCGAGNSVPFTDSATCGTISGNVYHDTNQNGVKEAGETNIQGIKLELSGNTTLSAVTDTGGNYSFTVPLSGTYIVGLVPGEFTATTTTPRTGISPTTTVNFGIYAPPLTVSGLKGWYDAANTDQSVNGGAVATWFDKSGNGNNATQSVAADKPTYQSTGGPNSKPSIRFSSNDSLLTSSFSQAQPLTVLAVVKKRTNDSVQQWIYQAQNNGGPGMGYYPSSNTIYIHSGSYVSTGTSAAAVDVTKYHMIIGTYNGGSSNLWVDGTQFGPNTAGSNQINSGLRFGTAYDGTAGLDGDIAEIIVYAGALSSQDRETLGTYFYQKYDIGYKAPNHSSLASNLVSWYDANQETYADAASVTNWHDKSGNSRDLLTGVAPTFKTNILNGHPVVRFSGTNYLFNTTTPLSQPFTAFVVAKETGGATGKMVIDGNSSNFVQLFAYSSTLWQFEPGSIKTPAGSTGNFTVLSFVANGASSIVSANGQTATGNSGAIGSTGLRIGVNNAPAGFFTGDVAEVIIYNSAFSDADRRSVENYLKQKYGL
jgi:Tfp pilus assembly protein PilV